MDRVSERSIQRGRRNSPGIFCRWATLATRYTRALGDLEATKGCQGLEGQTNTFENTWRKEGKGRGKDFSRKLDPEFETLGNSEVEKSSSLTKRRLVLANPICRVRVGLTQSAEQEKPRTSRREPSAWEWPILDRGSAARA
ncbi:hypothetical protein NXS19_005473 [Fusarium pseudograminearum]|nr:hypothetical protein NXS19_005473 [Fusarium pseudograminearum]